MEGVMFVFAGFAWTLWTTRNKMSIWTKVSQGSHWCSISCVILPAEVERTAEGCWPGMHGDDQWGDHEL